MVIQDVIDLAASGELRSLALKDDNAAVLGYINLGMVELYKRFPLMTDEYLFDRIIGTDIYTLPADVMWVVSAYGTIIKDNRLELSELGINEEENPYSINTISWNQIQVNHGIAAGSASIIYSAAPPLYSVANLTDAIDLPIQFIEPLLHYVGYRAHGSLDGNIQAENSTHYQRFELSCSRIKTQGMYTSDDMNMDKRIINRGFV